MPTINHAIDMIHQLATARDYPSHRSNFTLGLKIFGAFVEYSDELLIQHPATDEYDDELIDIIIYLLGALHTIFKDNQSLRDHYMHTGSTIQLSWDMQTIQTDMMHIQGTLDFKALERHLIIHLGGVGQAFKKNMSHRILAYRILQAIAWAIGMIESDPDIAFSNKYHYNMNRDREYTDNTF